MTSIIQNRFAYSASLLLPLMAALWIATGPGSATIPAVTIVAVLGAATAGVAAGSVRNARTTGTISQLSFKTDLAAAPAGQAERR